MRQTLLGDANLDGRVNLQDFNCLGAYFGLNAGHDEPARAVMFRSPARPTWSKILSVPFDAEDRLTRPACGVRSIEQVV